MEIFGIAAFVLVAAMLTALLRQYLPAYGAVCLTLCAVLLLGRILQLAQPLVEWFSAAAGYLDGDSLSLIHIWSPELLEDLYILRYDETGLVQSAETDTAKLARLQYTLEGDLTQAMEEGAADFSIPLGTLLGLQLFSGRGPDITVKVIPLSHVESQVETGFSAAGVNQTKLQTDLVFSVQMCAVLAGMQVETTAQSTICVAQVLIVGQTPEFYVEGSG